MIKSPSHCCRASSARIVQTPRLQQQRAVPRTTSNPAGRRSCSSTATVVVAVLAGDDAGPPERLRVIAIDLRGFGGTENAPVDATRGVRDFSDDVCATVEALGIPTAHLVGWSMGGGVVMQYALDHPALSLTLQSPVSPYGFGGTRRDGSRLTDDDAGTGGGGANPDFVERLDDRDTSDEAQTSPRSVFRSGYVRPGYTSDARGRLGRVDAAPRRPTRATTPATAWPARTGRASPPGPSAC